MRPALNSLAALVAMSALLVAAQCNTGKPVPTASPAPLPPVVVVDAGPPPAVNAKCQQTLTLVLAEGCTLPNSWLSACSVARANGSTFNLECFAIATDCDAVALCESGKG